VDDHRLTDAPGTPSDLVADPAPPARLPAAPSTSLFLDVRRPAWKLVLGLAWPVLVQQFLILAVNLSDRLLAGRFQHLDAADQVATQAAQTTAHYLAWFLTSYTVLVTVGGTALVAHFLGAGDRRGAIRVTHQTLLLATVLGLLGTTVGLIGLPALVRVLQLQGPAADFAVAYLRPLFALLVFQVIEAGGIACLAGAGDTRTGLWVLGGVALINLPLAWVIFHGVGPLPGMGFTGIALGTAVSHVLGAVAVLAVLARGRAGLRIHWRGLRPQRDLLRRLLRISVPAAADSLAVAVGQLWFLGIVNGLGDTAEAAHGIALVWEALGYLSGSAFGTAAMTLVGQNLGAGRPADASRSARTAFLLGLSVMSFMGAVFFVLARPMFQVFCPGAGQGAIVAAGVPVLRLVAFAMPALASCIIFTAALRGAGDTRVPLAFNTLGFFGVRLPLAYLLTKSALALGLYGAWLAMFADLLVRGLFFLSRFAGGRWQRVGV
jgi:putative MATE family efflux protein